MREKFSRGMLIFYVTGAIAALAFLILFTNIELDTSIVCPLWYYFDYDCPGCGITRMCEALLDGNIYQAFRYNCFVFITAPIIIGLYIWQACVFIWNGKIIKNLDIILLGYAVALTVFGLLRNIEPFLWLAPTTVG